MVRCSRLIAPLAIACALSLTMMTDSAGQQPAPPDSSSLLASLDAPLLFVKRHSYAGIHIYDTYYKWPPGGGGIYVLENPSAPRSEWVVRPVIDATTQGTLGEGVYADPELSWDATRLVFSFKGEPNGNTCIYEIGVDGTGLRQISDPAKGSDRYRGSLQGHHDITPCYLPDDRIVFLSTRKSGLVPCFDTGVAILHVMNADGSDLHPISVNNVNEFDPCPLPDGRILFGRWEYVDKNALTIQSLWTVNPDGTQETALYANNMVFPEAILDARPVPDSRLIVGTFAKHNGTPRGSIAMVDPARGKNSPDAIYNFEHPDNPTYDQGDSCEPWPLSTDLVLFSGRPAGRARNVIELMDRSGHRQLVLEDPQYCLHSPMLIKPRSRPPVVADTIDRQARTGRFFLQDIYQGLPGVARGEVKWLRVLEETSRTSERTEGSNPYNQTFLLSSALAFSVKNFLGIVRVNEDGSAHFEVPAGRAIYFQALDADGRLVQSMRTFVQAAPGTTRSCIGCHEHKQTTVEPLEVIPRGLRESPSQLEPESWGSGFVDYASMVQPILDKHCVQCHGGEEDIAAGLDLSGGWTEHFNISYENLTNRSQTQLVAHWISGIDCMNGTALWSAQIFPPRTHGSGAAPLAELLIAGHDGRIPTLTRTERDLLLAWIDTNGLYYGTWNRSASGCRIDAWDRMKSQLGDQMRAAGCLECHGQNGKPVYFENDWVNLQHPRWSRILRAPLAQGGAGLGLAWCRRREVTPDRQRIHLLWNGYAHAVQPPAAFSQHPLVRPDRSGEPAVTFASTDDPHYQTMLAVIHDARQAALAVPRVDMPGAEVLPGTCRLMRDLELPQRPLGVHATVEHDGAVALQWTRSAQSIGLEFEVHRGADADLQPCAETLLARTPLFSYIDLVAPVGRQYYLVRPMAGESTAASAIVKVDIPPIAAPAAPRNLRIVPTSATVHLQWQAIANLGARYHVYRAPAGSRDMVKLTKEPTARTDFVDYDAVSDVEYDYWVTSVSRRGLEGQRSESVRGVAHVVTAAMFDLPLKSHISAKLFPAGSAHGRAHGDARVDVSQALVLGRNGYLTFAHADCFDLTQPFCLSCRVRFDEPGTMPVVVSCGAWAGSGWFLQRLGSQWRWYAGGVVCDGGAPEVGKWFTLTGTFDGRCLRLYENGKLVAETFGEFSRDVWPGPLYVGQYSAQPGPQYQVTGRIRDVRIHHHVLSATEIREFAAAGDQ